MPFILTDELRQDTVRDGVAVVGLPRLSIVSAVPLLAFALRHAGVVGRTLRASWNVRRVLHALRLEHAAASIVRRERIDLVHSHFGWPAGFGGSLAVAATGTPLVTSIRGTDVLIREDLGYGLRRDKGYDVALRHLFTKARRVLTATGFMRRTTEALGAPARTLRVLDKGVDAETFMPPADREAVKRALRLSGPVVLAVGSLKRRKGFEAIIDALAPLKAEPWTLVICGGGEEHAALERRAADAGIASRTVFAGHVPRADIPTWFAAADVFVHAAELEAAGNVVLEALAAGCAVVCTDSGGPGGTCSQRRERPGRAGGGCRRASRGAGNRARRSRAAPTLRARGTPPHRSVPHLPEDDARAARDLRRGRRARPRGRPVIPPRGGAAGRRGTRRWWRCGRTRIAT